MRLRLRSRDFGGFAGGEDNSGTFMSHPLIREKEREGFLGANRGKEQGTETGHNSLLCRP